MFCLASEEMTAIGVAFGMPSSTRGKKQLSSVDIETSKNLVHVRIPVKRVIGRLKNFLVLQKVFQSSNDPFDRNVPVNQAHVLDNIVIVVRALHNLMSSIVKD